MRKASTLSIRHWENVQPTSATTNTLYIWKQILCFGVCYSEHNFKGICFRKLHSKTHIYITPPGVSKGLTLWTMLTMSNREAINKPREKQTINSRYGFPHLSCLSLAYNNQCCPKHSKMTAGDFTSLWSLYQNLYITHNLRYSASCAKYVDTQICCILLIL